LTSNSDSWNTKLISDVVELKYGKGLKESERERGIIPVYGSKAKIGYHNKYLVKGPGIIIGRKGNVGFVNLSRGDFWPIDTTYYVIFKDKEDYVFWYYLFQTLNLNQMNSHSAVPGLNKDYVYNLKVKIPEYREQQTIAKILSDLDEKIEVNNQMNKTLEEIAQAIFKRWFIDFEFPNENGEPYKTSGGEMVESELGMIPKGWEIVSLSNIADFLNGLPLQNYRPREDEECLPVIKIRELRNGFTDSTERCTSNIPKSYIAENGDVIFSWSGSLEVVIWSYGKGAINQHLFKVSSEKYPKWFYYFWLLRFLPEFRKIAEDKATTMGHIQRHHLNESLLPVPPQELMDKFGKPIESEFEEAITLRIQSMTLSNLRDILLPKLMTGRIRVPLED